MAPLRPQVQAEHGLRRSAGGRDRADLDRLPRRIAPHQRRIVRFNRLPCGVQQRQPGPGDVALQARRLDAQGDDMAELRIDGDGRAGDFAAAAVQVNLQGVVRIAIGGDADLDKLGQSGAADPPPAVGPAVEVLVGRGFEVAAIDLAGADGPFVAGGLLSFGRLGGQDR